MIFAIIGEELGLVGAAAVIAAYCAFAYIGLKIALGCRTRSASGSPPASPFSSAARRRSISRP